MLINIASVIAFLYCYIIFWLAQWWIFCTAASYNDTYDIGRKSMKKQLLNLLKWRREQLWQNLCWRLHCSTSLAKLKCYNLHGIFKFLIALLFTTCTPTIFYNFFSCMVFNLIFSSEFCNKLWFLVGYCLNHHTTLMV